MSGTNYISPPLFKVCVCGGWTCPPPSPVDAHAHSVDRCPGTGYKKRGVPSLLTDFLLSVRAKMQNDDTCSFNTTRELKMSCYQWTIIPHFDPKRNVMNKLGYFHTKTLMCTFWSYYTASIDIVFFLLDMFFSSSSKFIL